MLGFSSVGGSLFILVLAALWIQESHVASDIITSSKGRKGRGQGMEWGHGRNSPTTIFLQHFSLISKGLNFLGARMSFPCTLLFRTRSLSGILSSQSLNTYKRCAQNRLHASGTVLGY